MVALQLSLLGPPPPTRSPFSRAQRIDLGADAWLEHVHGFVAQPETLFATLQQTMQWRADRRVMYERVVEVPRLRSSYPRDGEGHPHLDAMAKALSARYEACFDAITLALYRDGADSVAWHRDREHRDCQRSVVCVVSLGGPRRFAVRPFEKDNGTRACQLVIASGDLVVMGGSCQRSVEHTVPKMRVAPSRMALMFRHTVPQRDVPAPH